MFTYRMDVLERLKDAGYTTYRLRKDRIFSEKTIAALRHGELVSFATYDKLCTMLGCDLGDILGHVEQIEIEGM